MASPVRQKEALRAALLGYLAGAHCVTEVVNQMQTLIYDEDEQSESEDTSARKEMILSNYERFLNSKEVVDQLVESLNDEELYPFLNEWSSDALYSIYEKVKPLNLTISDGEEEADREDTYIDSDDGDVEISIHETAFSIDPALLIFKFKKGFQKQLNYYASTLESTKKKPVGIDHWLNALLSASFRLGMTHAAQSAENTEAYYEAIQEIENEEEPWSRYPQLIAIFERQLRRETRKKSGLVSDLDM